MNRVFKYIVAAVVVTVVLTAFMLMNTNKVLDKAGTPSGSPELEGPPPAHTGAAAMQATPSLLLNNGEEDFVDPLHWTTVRGMVEEDSPHLSSAYYDERNASSRPAVVVFGYRRRSAPAVAFYCLYKYADGRTECIQQQPTVNELDSHNAFKMKAAPLAYNCRVMPGSEIPEYVALSTSKDCDVAYSSDYVPVRYSKHSTQPEPQVGVGVCVQTPVFNETGETYEHTKQKLLDFIEMNRALGVELITLYYLSNIDSRIVSFLRDRYAKENLLQVVKWKPFTVNEPMHYFGELLVIQECLYRNLHRVKYLAMIDIDEIVLPYTEQSLGTMMHKLDQDHGNTASFVFKNVMFFDAKTNRTSLPELCQGYKVPKFVQWKLALACQFPYGTRSKVIVRTDLAVELDIHTIFSAVHGRVSRSFNVPQGVAVLAHYRDVPLGQCNLDGAKEDRTAMKYREQVLDSLKHNCV